MSEKTATAELSITLNVVRKFTDDGEVSLEDQAQEYGRDLAGSFDRMSSKDTTIDWNDVTVLEVKHDE